MNSDEYHAFTQDNDHQPNPCPFCGRSFDEHERACPHRAEDRHPVVDQLQEDPQP